MSFPVHVESAKRYLVDAQGKPFLIQADAPWSLIVALTDTQVDQYLSDRQERGFNAVLVNLIEHKFSPNPPSDVYGNAPFLVSGDFSTPNEAYFARAAGIIQKALDRGILVLLAPAYMGYGGGDEGWYQEMVSNDTSRLNGYGRYVATRFASYPNILWVEGGDYDPPDKSLLDAVANGIRSVDAGALQTFHAARGSTAAGVLGATHPWLNVNNIYTDASTVVSYASQAFAGSAMPFFLIEGTYENEGVDESGVRQQAYQAVLSGAAGQVMGNSPIWFFGSGWQTQLASGASQTIQYLNRLLATENWWAMAPDGGSLLTGGAGSGSNQAVASRASDGSFALIYIPSGQSVNLDLSRMSGPNVAVRWYDPTSGIYAVASGSPFTATGTRSFSPAGTNHRGYNDWVLVLESSP